MKTIAFLVGSIMLLAAIFAWGIIRFSRDSSFIELFIRNDSKQLIESVSVSVDDKVAYAASNRPSLSQEKVKIAVSGDHAVKLTVIVKFHGINSVESAEIHAWQGSAYDVVINLHNTIFIQKRGSS